VATAATAMRLLTLRRFRLTYRRGRPPYVTLKGADDGFPSAGRIRPRDCVVAIALRGSKPAVATMGPGETGDFTYVPTQPGRMSLEVWTESGQRVVLPVEIGARSAAVKH
jgi:hypothetical protein